MSKERMKCCCSPNYKCSAPLHIITCKKNCGLGCDKPIEKSRRYE